MLPLILAYLKAVEYQFQEHFLDVEVGRDFVNKRISLLYDLTCKMSNSDIACYITCLHPDNTSNIIFEIMVGGCSH